MKAKKDKIIFRPVKDESEYLSIYREENEEVFQAAKSQLKYAFQEASKGNRIILGAYIDNSIVGGGQIIFMQKNEQLPGKKVARLHDIRILEKMRGQGIGTLFMNKLEEEAKKRDYEILILYVDQANKGARKL